MSNLQMTVHGAIGVGFIHVLASIDPTQLTQIASLIIQIVVALGTLWSIFKTKAT